MQLLYRNDGVPVQVGAQLARGGQGSIHLVEDEPGLLAKLYHDLPDGAQQHKLRAMLRNQPADLADVCAWPVRTLHLTTHGPAHGFLMRKFAGYAPVHQAYDAASCAATFPDATWALHARGALALARVVAGFHARGQVIGDLNPNNCLINASGHVALVDCDSHQIITDGRIYPCTVAMPEFSAPELQRRSLERAVRTTRHDAYALALLVFHLLMMGRHPFAGNTTGQQEPDLLDAMRDGEFAFAGGGRAHSPQQRAFDQLPEDLRDAFVQTFGRNGAGARPDAAAWAALLEPLVDTLQTCTREPRHVFAGTASACPWCADTARDASLFAARNTPPHAHLADVATAAASIKHALRHAELPKPREFADPRPTPARRAVKWKVLQSRLPVLRSRARRWLVEQHTHAQEVALKWHQVRQSYIDTVQYRSTQRALADCQTRIQQWERETNNSVFHIKQRANWREQVQPLLSAFMLAEAPLPMLNQPVLDMLRDEGIATAADLSERNCSAISEHSELLALTLWNWRDALERLLCCWLQADGAANGETARFRHNLEREIVFNAQRVLGEVSRARLAEADAAQEVLVADAQYGRVLGELPYLSG